MFFFKKKKTQDWTDGKEGSWWRQILLGDLCETDVITMVHSKGPPTRNWKRNLCRWCGNGHCNHVLWRQRIRIDIRCWKRQNEEICLSRRQPCGTDLTRGNRCAMRLAIPGMTTQWIITAFSTFAGICYSNTQKLI